jgi:AsmA protein
MNWAKIRKRLLKFIGHLIVDVLVIVLLVFTLFYFFEDEIKNEVLEIVNQNQNGEIEIKEIDLTLLKYFPFISLQLEDVVYHEGNWGEISKYSSIISEIKNLDVSFNVVDLIQGNINVEKLTIEGGKINLIVHPDSSINLMNALGRTSSEEDTSATELILKNVTITDVVLNYKNNIGHHEAILRIERWTNNLAIINEHIYCHLDLDGWLQKLSIDDDFKLENDQISASVEFVFNLDSLSGELNESKIEIDKLILLAQGNFGFGSHHLAEIDLELSDENIELLSSIFSSKLLPKQENLVSQGSLYGRGNIKWKSFDVPPIIDFKFGIQDLSIVFPQDATVFVYLDFDGHFYTGKNPNLSEMKFELTDMEIRLPGGWATGSLYLNDWQNPAFDIKLNADLNVAGYEDIFNIKEVDSLKGRIKIQSSLSGKYNNLSQILSYENENVNITFDNLCLALPDIDQKITQLNGHITQSAYSIYFQDLSIVSPGGSIMVKGKLTNLYSYILDGGKRFSGNLQIHSNHFELDKILGKENGLVNVIGNEINNIDADVAFKNQVHTDTLTRLKIININECSFGIRSYPDVRRLTGELVLQDKLLSFKNLQLKTDSGNLIANGELDISPESSVNLNSSIYLTDFYINKFATKNPNADEIRLDVSGKLQGNLSIRSGQMDDYLYLSDFMIDHSNFQYLNKTDKDTVTLLGLSSDVDYVAINVSDGDKILSTLDVSGKVESRQLKVNEFKHRNLVTSIGGKTGRIRLGKNQIELFGIQGEMIIDVDFTDDVYTYRIEQKVIGHDINHILDSVTENDLVDGLLDISFWVEMNGNTWQENLRTMRGELSNRGKHLRIKKIDIDDVIQKFKNTQNFKLLDVGAFIFAGPAGAVVTKSVDYANLLRMNPGDSTVISDFIMEIEIKNGITNIEDMAFSTEQNRIVFDGEIDLVNQLFINFVIAIVNKDGCIMLSQQLNGPFAEPTLEEFNAISTVLAPITNAYNSIVGNDCTPFYTGEIAHPN